MSGQACWLCCWSLLYLCWFSAYIFYELWKRRWWNICVKLWVFLFPLAVISIFVSYILKLLLGARHLGLLCPLDKLISLLSQVLFSCLFCMPDNFLLCARHYTFYLTAELFSGMLFNYLEAVGSWFLSCFRWYPSSVQSRTKFIPLLR